MNLRILGLLLACGVIGAVTLTSWRRAEPEPAGRAAVPALP